MAEESEQLSQAQAQAVFQAALASPLPRFYANMFMNAGSDSDIMTVFQCNGQNVCVMNMSYVTAKTLAEALAELVTTYETRHKIAIPTMEKANTAVADE
jgi:hypothetical protein